MEENLDFFIFNQGVQARMLGRQNERNNSYIRLACTSIFGLFFMPVCLLKSNCYSLKASFNPKLKGSVCQYFVKSYQGFVPPSQTLISELPLQGVFKNLQVIGYYSVKFEYSCDFCFNMCYIG